MTAKTVGAAVLLGCGLASSAAHAGGENVMGGRVVTRAQLYATAGYPDIEFGVHIPISKVELTPNVRFAYGYGVGIGELSLQPGLAARFQVFGKKGAKWAGSITASLPLILSFTPGRFGDPNGVGVGLGLLSPGFMVTYDLSPEFDIDFGMEANTNLQFVGNNAYFFGGVPLKAGVEFHPADKIQLAVRVDGGPGFSAGVGGGLAVYPTIRGFFAFGYSF